MLLRGSSIQYLIISSKEALKKARERVLRSCSYRPLCRAKSFVNLDEGGVSPVPAVPEKEPTENFERIEPVERIEEQRVPCTCVGKPWLRLTQCLNTEGDISAAPSQFEGLPSGKKKPKLVTPLVKNRTIINGLLICASIYTALSVSLFVGGVIYISSFKGKYKRN